MADVLVATRAINPASISIYLLNLLCIIHLLKVFKGHLFISIMTHFKATESTNNNRMKTLIHYPDLWNSNILINLHSFFLNIIIEAFCVSFLFSFPFWLNIFTLVAESGAGVFSEPNNHHLQESVWSCSPRSSQLGLLTVDISSWKDRVGIVIGPSPEYSATFPNQVYSILH